MTRARVGLLAVLVAAALTPAGCGLGAGGRARATSTLTVTRDFGAQLLGRRALAGVPGWETVMRLLQRNFDVTTRYGGGFVQSIDGSQGQRRAAAASTGSTTSTGSRPIDGRGGPARRRRRPHLVGPARLGRRRCACPPSWARSPSRSCSASDGKRLPVRLDCAQDEQRACDEVATRLTNAGITGISRSSIGVGADSGVLRVVVGRWPDVRRDAAAQQLEHGPARVGRVRTARPRRPADYAARRSRRRRALARSGAAGSWPRRAVGRPGADLGRHRHRRRRASRPRLRRSTRTASPTASRSRSRPAGGSICPSRRRPRNTP